MAYSIEITMKKTAALTGLSISDGFYAEPKDQDWQRKALNISICKRKPPTHTSFYCLFNALPFSMIPTLCSMVRLHSQNQTSTQPANQAYLGELIRDLPEMAAFYMPGLSVFSAVSWISSLSWSCAHSNRPHWNVFSACLSPCLQVMSSSTAAVVWFPSCVGAGLQLVIAAHVHVFLMWPGRSYELLTGQTQFNSLSSIMRVFY